MSETQTVKGQRQPDLEGQASRPGSDLPLDCSNCPKSEELLNDSQGNGFLVSMALG